MQQKKRKERKRLKSAYYSLSTKLWIPSLPAATLSDMATMAAGKPAVEANRQKVIAECP